ncbi:MAG: hypothetical protein PHD11_08325 [Bacteroidales bacterium]|nr:hypothetical protein [Bacteroidales bacterium]MDD4669604.1 hypothetical protein [Bacteroidales bacterium]
MNEIEFIDDAILKDASVSKTRKNPATSIALVVAGIILIIVAIVANSNADLSFGFMFAGFISVIVGIVGVFAAKGVMKYTPTNEKMIRKEMFFSTKDRNLVIECVGCGDIDRLSKMAVQNHSSLKIVAYYTATYSCVISQVQEYIPYQYVPVTESSFFHDSKPFSLAS